VKYGGENSAPSPYDHFLASIGTCIGFYVHRFCEKWNIPTEKISLAECIEHGKTKDGKDFIEKIVFEIIVPPDFPEKYYSALIKVADQCSVKKSILNPPKFEVITTVKSC
jgi:putative redox protein